MKTLIKYLTISILIIASLTFIQSLSASAYQIDPSFRPVNSPFNLDYSKSGEESADNAVTIIQIIAGGLLYFAAPITIIFIAYSGLQMVIGGAESDKLDEAKTNLKWAIGGLLLIILSYSIIRIVIDITLKAGSAVTI